MNEKNIRLVTAESVRAGHPDKFCDQVADAILDAHLRLDPNARVAVEVFATAGKIVVGGEITSKAKVSYDKIVAGVINRIGYTMSDLCGDSHGLLELEVCLHEQSPDISAAVDKTELGAGETLGAGCCRRRPGGVQWTGSAFVSIPTFIASFHINSPHGYVAYRAAFLCLFFWGRYGKCRWNCRALIT